MRAAPTSPQIDVGRFAAGALALISIGGCAPLPPPGAVTPEGRVRVVGYNDMDEMLDALGKGFARHHPGVRFDFQLKSTRSAPDTLIEGRSAFAPMGAELEPQDIARYRARYGIEPVEIRIAHDSFDPAALSSPTGIFVHRDNPVRALSLDQLKLAFSAREGAARLTWGELGVGGPWQTAPVHLKGLAADTAIGRRTAKVLGITEFAKDFESFRQSRDVVAASATDPYALAFANLNHARAELRAIDLLAGGKVRRPDRETVAAGRYPLDRHLLIYAPRGVDGSVPRFVARFVRYVLSEEGQSIIASGTKGYLPLSKTERKIEAKKLD
jgi:phosphate transport system substrate-binding protein